MGAEDEVSNGRVTTREFYAELQEVRKEIEQLREKQIDKLENMERRIMAKLDPLPALCNQVETNKKEIDTLRRQSNARDIFNGALAVIASSLAAMFGK